jgi:hypothetical protein
MSEQDTPATDEWQERAEHAEAALAALQAEAKDKLIRAELKAEAVRAGMIDLDGLKLLDLSQVAVDENGNVVEPERIFQRLKRTKPWLFGGGSSSSVAAHAPRPEAPRQRQASEMSHEEWLAARAALIKRR